MHPCPRRVFVATAICRAAMGLIVTTGSHSGIPECQVVARGYTFLSVGEQPVQQLKG